MSDYRINGTADTFRNIAEQKKVLAAAIQKKHPKTKQVYGKIRDKNLAFNGTFRQIYLKRCAYCGISTEVIDRNQFEVDHFVPQAQDKTKVDVHAITNLVSSCRECNRKKSDFRIDNQYIELLHPDKQNIRQVFARTETFQIKINEQYLSDDLICKFYEQLQLGSFARQIDFLIMEMKQCLARNTNWSDKKRAGYQALLLKIISWRNDPF